MTKKVNNVTTYYIRDAQGNTLATYEQNGNNTNLTEQHLYGSARIGMRQTNLLVKNSAGIVSLNPNQRVSYRSVGHKAYEQTNHLGDVLVTLSDKVLNQGGYYQAIVKNASLTYPFGWAIPERTYTSASGEYRFGFNGVEESPEIGEGHTSTFYREMDTRTARWWSTDPRPNASVSQYAMMENNPIRFADALGDSVSPALNDMLVDYEKKAKEKIASHKKELLKIKGKKDDLSKKNSQGYQEVISILENSLNDIKAIRASKDWFNHRAETVKNVSGSISYDPTFDQFLMHIAPELIDKKNESYYSTIGHELKHLRQVVDGDLAFSTVRKKIGTSYWGVASNIFDFGDEQKAFEIDVAFAYRGHPIYTPKELAYFLAERYYSMLPKVDGGLNLNSMNGRGVRNIEEYDLSNKNNYTTLGLINRYSKDQGFNENQYKQK